MSWDKNTYIISEIDTVIKLWKDLRLDYKLKTIAEVIAMGINDSFEDRLTYPLRILLTSKKIFVEQMQRTYDCDSDDCVRSVALDMNDLPEKFPLEVYSDYQNFVDMKEDDEGNLQDHGRAAKEENFVNIKEIVNKMRINNV